MLLVGGLVYAKSNEMFAKKSLDSVIPHDMSHDDGHGGGDEHH